MAKAKRVHSTPRKSVRKIQSKPAVSVEDTSLDLAYRRLEDRVNDLDRLCEITLNIIHEWHQNPKDNRLGAHAATIAEITQDHMREFRATYYDWYHAPLKEGDDYVIIPMVSRKIAMSNNVEGQSDES
jgi:hypothetical protein